MIWQLLACLTAVFYASQNLVVKYVNRWNVRREWVLWVMFAGAPPVLLIFYQWGAPHPVESEFYLWLSLGVLGNLVAFYGYVRAIELADVSLVSPLLALSPFFMLLTSWLMVSEVPDLRGLVGILAVVGGTYVLVKEPGRTGWEPLVALVRETGPRWALITSLLWSVTANLDKLSVRASTPLGYSFWFHVVMGLLLVPILFRRDGVLEISRSREKFRPLMGIIGLLIGIGVLQALMSAVQMTAIIRTDVTYVIAVKRAGMMISVLGGGMLLGERDLPKRFGAAVVIFIGLIGIMFR